ncbi:response regulator transcription factor [Foetidibacter luteolus]|uniref:response regulator transcription factor n=1 Tax=Foetidibacter luteolus TaxID=2608880 RepID=UPI00129B564B|nr:response regulator transcription factor [Foetidibacter luteolus]
MNKPAYTTPSIVVVEDDESMQNILNVFLGKNFTLQIFTDGLQALTYLQQGNLPDAIIADLNTPRLGGLELIIQLKSSGFFSMIPVLVLSGEESTETRVKCLEAGADDYLVKPFSPRELEARLKIMLRRIGKTVS